MRYYAIVVFSLMVLGSCGGGSSPVVQNPPVGDPPGQDPPVDNHVVKLTLTISSITDTELDVFVTGGTGPYTIKVSEPTGLTAETTQVESLNGQATFTFAASQPALGGGGLCFISAQDANGILERTDTFIGIDAVPLIDTIQLNDDTLYAIPMQHEVKVGKPVTIVVATGRTAHPFQFMLSVGVTFDSDGMLHSFDGEDIEYVNFGSPGGDYLEADGVWADITQDRGFIVGPDMILKPGANPEDTLGTRHRVDFNVSPLVGSDVASVKGALFNTQLIFREPGLKRIGFQEFNGVTRTYYSYKAAGQDTFTWSVLMADEMGNLHPSVVGQVDNTIMVVE